MFKEGQTSRTSTVAFVTDGSDHGSPTLPCGTSVFIGRLEEVGVLRLHLETKLLLGVRDLVGGGGSPYNVDWPKDVSPQMKCPSNILRRFSLYENDSTSSFFSENKGF